MKLESLSRFLEWKSSKHTVLYRIIGCIRWLLDLHQRVFFSFASDNTVKYVHTTLSAAWFCATSPISTCSVWTFMRKFDNEQIMKQQVLVNIALTRCMGTEVRALTDNASSWTLWVLFGARGDEMFLSVVFLCPAKSLREYMLTLRS